MARRAIASIGALAGVSAVVGLVAGFQSRAFLVTLAVDIVVVSALDRWVAPTVERWRRGAAGEEAVGRILDDLAARGWFAFHDISLGRGNVDHIVVGPGGLFTIETKSHPGRRALDSLDPRMLRQAYAQKKALERVTGKPVTPLLVFSRAYLEPAVGWARGVTVLPARMLVRHLERRSRVLNDEEVERLRDRLAAVFGDRA